MAGKHRRTAFALALTVIFAILFSVCFVIAESGHECIGEDCPVCFRIDACENMLKILGRAAAAVTVSVFAAVSAAVFPLCAKKTAYRASLVALKVKLSD